MGLYLNEPCDDLYQKIERKLKLQLFKLALY